MKAKKHVSLLIAISMIVSMFVAMPSASAAGATIYYSEDFDDVTDVQAWSSAEGYKWAEDKSGRPKDGKLFGTWGSGSDKFAIEELGGSKALKVLSGTLDAYPLKVTPGTGKYEMTVDVMAFDGSSTTSYGNVAFQMGSANVTAWPYANVSLGKATSSTKATEFFIAGNKATMAANTFVNLKAIYDCEAGTVTLSAYQNGATLIENIVLPFKDGFTQASSKLIWGGATSSNYEALRFAIDNVVVKDYEEPEVVEITRAYPWKVEQGKYGGGKRVEGYTTSAYEGNYALAMSGTNGSWSKPALRLNLDSAVNAGGLQVKFMHKGAEFELYSMRDAYNADAVAATVPSHADWTEVTVDIDLSSRYRTSEAIYMRAEKSPWDDSYILIDNLTVLPVNDGVTGENVFSNSGFEYLEEPEVVEITQAYPWMVEQGPYGGGGRVEGYTTSAYEGNYALAMSGTNGSWSKPALRLNLDSAVNVAGLHVTFMHKGEGFELYSMRDAYNADAVAATVPSHEDWTEFTVDIDLSSRYYTSQAIYMRAEKSPWDDSYILIDNLTVLPVNDGVTGENVFSNSGFEYLEAPEMPEEPEFDGIYYSEDFNDVTDVAAWSAAEGYPWSATEATSGLPKDGKLFGTWGSGSDKFAIEELGGSKALKVLNGTLDAYPLKVTPGTGKYTMTFDVMALDGSDTTKYSNVGFHMGSANVSAWPYANVTLGSPEGSTDATEFFIVGNKTTMAADTFVNVRAVYDCEARTVTLSAYQNGTVLIEGVALPLEDWFTQAKSKLIWGGATHSNHEALQFALDNVVVRDWQESDDEITTPDTPETPELPEYTAGNFSEDFENITDSAAWEILCAGSNGLPANNSPIVTWGERTQFNVETVGDTKALRVQGAALDVYPLYYTDGMGKYKFSFDMKPDETVTKTGFNGSVYYSTIGGLWSDIGFLSSAGADLEGGTYDVDTIKLIDNSNAQMTFEKGSWIHFDVVYDCDTLVAEITAKAGDQSVTANKTFSMEDNAPKVMLNGFKYTDDTFGCWIDNISVTEVGEEIAPKLTANSIKVYAGDVEQSIAGSVSAFADKVTVNFGQKMLAADLTADNIYVTEKGSETKLAYEPNVNGYVYEMTFAEGFTAGKTYTVTVNKIKNIGEVEMLQSYAFDFTVKAGIYADLIDVTIGDNTVTTATEMVAGSNATINIQYNNSTTDSPTIYVIVAYYNGDKLTKCEYLTQPTTGPSTINYQIPYTVPTVEDGFDEVNIMVWDGFNSMKPLSEAINF